MINGEQWYRMDDVRAITTLLWFTNGASTDGLERGETPAAQRYIFENRSTLAQFVANVCRHRPNEEFQICLSLWSYETQKEDFSQFLKAGYCQVELHNF